MAKFTMLIGIPASGKSSYARGLSSGRVLSSDAIRETVLGDRKDQSHQGMVFDIMNRSAKILLEEGHHVFYDATNISAKRRMALLKTLPKDTYKEALYFAIPVEDAISRDKKREHKVGEDVIMRMYKSLDVPMVHEGFDNIEYVKSTEYTGGDKKCSVGYHELSTTIDTCFTSYQSFVDKFLKPSRITSGCIDFAQDNPNHTYSVSKHMYHTMEKFRDGNNDRLTMAAALHDCGKPHCKEFKEDGYACFYGHDKVSAQLAVYYMLEKGFKIEDIAYVSTLINLHMRMHQQEGRTKLKKLIGEKMYKELELLHQADSTAK